ncbi:Phospholipid-transporting ATPase ID [Collichthys lucidus]|uniref:Phospholipid-transporting ATPase n=1 Tax=Collichthys lucidus TaxID=240159 RepID=A0A4U5V395_COLLU|nr:Phospholipid-transporting ATPase ID [Collichthys lucidus]
MAFSVGVMSAMYLTKGITDAIMDFSGGVLTVYGPNETASIFATYPSEYMTLGRSFLDQVVGTGMLMLCILCLGEKRNTPAPAALIPPIVAVIVLGISMSMSANCGAAINPARDLGPRLFTLTAGWGTEVFTCYNYWFWVPLVAPPIGGVIGSFMYVIFIEWHLPDPDQLENPSTLPTISDKIKQPSIGLELKDARSDGGGEGEGGAAPPPPPLPSSLLSPPLSSPLPEAKPSLTSARCLQQRIQGSCFTLPPHHRASSFNSSRKPHHDLGERISEDVSTRKIFITPTCKARSALLFSRDNPMGHSRRTLAEWRCSERGLLQFKGAGNCTAARATLALYAVGSRCSNHLVLRSPKCRPASSHTDNSLSYGIPAMGGCHGNAHQTQSWLRNAYSCEEERRVRANDREYNERFQYASNCIMTSKYNIITFLPVNLFEQFQEVANTYFLFLLILQLIPQISSLSWFTTIVPLALVLSITAVKDATDDYFRHKSDNQVNNRQSQVLIHGSLQNEKWMNVRVGDIIKLENNQFVAKQQDTTSKLLCVVLSCRETNMKVRQSVSVTSELGDQNNLASFDGEVVCEPPNNKLDRFCGTLYWQEKKYTLSNQNMLLRGCVLRNTEACYGLVIFAGPDTKLMQNSGRTKFKRTSIDRLMNTLVLWIFGFLVCMGVILAVGNAVWEREVGSLFQSYLPWDPPVDNFLFSAFLSFWSYVIILNTVVPISLYVSVEVIRLGHSYFINWDQQMFCSQCNTAAEARTTTLNEELGQVEYIFSDKTGTLTQNIMSFNKCSINGQTYGEVTDPLAPQPKRLDFTPFNPLADPDFCFYDDTLLESVKVGDSHTHEFFRLLSLCHTVMSEEKSEGELVYKAQSPDEGALVTAARNFGFVFRSRTPGTITTTEMGRPATYSLLAILDFNNIRKRMSVIVRNPEGRIRLYCKGADTVLLERLHPCNQELMNITSDHLNEYAADGLRTLALAYRDLSEDEWESWSESHRCADKATNCREDRLAAAYEEIEQDMMLLGATAIEDKLQEGVPETIAVLSLANIKIWVLTGDKQETAVNIGYSCKMLTDDMTEVFNITGHTVQSAHALEADMEMEFLSTACACKAVICCRVTPLQKAQVVELIKKHKKAVTLAIGDGANDVSMIKSAHIGVGISGQEGIQAVLASDYSFAQFRFLQRLLLVHGRWSYLRMCRFLCYFFYKNFAFTMVHFWFGFFCGFSAQTVYDQYFITLYNIVYTSLPVLAMGIFDQDVPDLRSLEYPKLYEPGQLNLLFNKREFFICITQGIYTSVVLFFVPCAILSDATQSNGVPLADYQTFAVTTATALVIVVSVQIALDTGFWTVINHVFVWGSLGSYFTIMLALHSQTLFRIFPNQFHFVGSAQSTLLQPVVWLTIALATAICIVPVLAFRFLKVDLKPQLSDTVRYTQLVHQKKRKPVGRSMGGAWNGVGSVSESRLGARGGSRRSGYAFAHQEGFGELITSGKNMRLSSLALATFASRHSSSWIDTLRRKKHTHAHTPPSASGECSPAPSYVSGSVAPLSNSSSVLGGSQDTPIEEETGTAPAQNTQTVLTSSTPALAPTSEAAAPQASGQAPNAGILTPTAVRLDGGDSPGGWTITLETVQEALFGWKARATASNSPGPPSVAKETSQNE